MAKLYNIKKGQFEDSAPKNRAKMIEMPAPNTILKGKGAPSKDLGDDGDFYIDTEALMIYERSAEGWGEGASIVGKDGESVKGEKGDKGDKGDKGEAGKDGRDGKDGAPGARGSDGKPGAQGLPGLPGQAGRDGANGKDGREIELTRTQTHVMWRRAGEKDWRDLMPIPKARSSSAGGGAYKLKDLFDINFTGIADNYVLTYNSATQEFDWSAQTGGGGGVSRSINNISSDTTAGSAASTDYVYFCTGTFTFTLPTAVGNTNRYTVANQGSGKITLAAVAGSINGNQPLVQQYQAYDLISDGTNWNIV